MSTIICHYLTNGVILLTIFILGEIIFGLDAFGDWEELTLDKMENLVIFSKNSCYEKLFTGSSIKYSTKSKLSDIRHVGVSQNMGLFILPRNGKVMTFGTQGLTRNQLQSIKSDIIRFLNLNRIECPENNLLNISESDQYLQALLEKCNCRVNLQELFLQNKKNFHPPIQQHQSSPLLYQNKQNSQLYHKRPYDTDDLQNIQFSFMRRGNSIPRR